jgi:hypothetical protein
MLANLLDYKFVEKGSYARRMLLYNSSYGLIGLDYIYVWLLEYGGEIFILLT